MNWIKDMKTTLPIEWLKIKNTSALLLSILTPLFLSTMIFCIFYFEGDHFLKNVENAWPTYIKWCCRTGLSLLFPLFIILLQSLINTIEYKANSWKQSFCFPLSKGSIITSKFLIAQTLIAFSLLLFFLFSSFFGILIEIKLPDHFQFQWIYLFQYFKLLILVYLSSILMSSIQFFISLNWSKMNVSLSIGIGGFVSGMIHLQGWKYILYHPYMMPLTITKPYLNNLNAELLNQYSIYSIAGGIIITIFSFLVIKKRKILNT